MVNKEKDILFEVLHSSENYFLPISVNDNWNDMGAIDKVKLCMILENIDFSFCCGHTFVNGDVWVIKITFRNPIDSSIIKHSNEASFLCENKEIRTLDIYVTKQEIKYLRTFVFQNDKSKFWDKLK